MSNQIIKLKRSNIPGKVPTPDALKVGEVALNMADSLLYYKDPDGLVKSLSVTNVLKLDNETEYVPTGDYNPATKAYVDQQTRVLQGLVGLKTIERTAILNNEITLPSAALGDIVFNTAIIFEDIDSNVFYDATCTLSEDKTKVLFDPNDNLDYRYCVVSYLTLR